MHSSHRSRRSRRFRIRRGNGDENSRMDGSSTNSGLMSRTTKKRSIRKGGGKRSVSLAMQNEILINKIQEQFGEFKNNHTSEITVSNAI